MLLSLLLIFTSLQTANATPTCVGGSSIMRAKVTDTARFMEPEGVTCFWFIEVLSSAPNSTCGITVPAGQVFWTAIPSMSTSVCDFYEGQEVMGKFLSIPGYTKFTPN